MDRNTPEWLAMQRRRLQRMEKRQGMPAVNDRITALRELITAAETRQARGGGGWPRPPPPPSSEMVQGTKKQLAEMMEKQSHLNMKRGPTALADREAHGKRVTAFEKVLKDQEAAVAAAAPPAAAPSAPKPVAPKPAAPAPEATPPPSKYVRHPLERGPQPRPDVARAENFGLDLDRLKGKLGASDLPPPKISPLSRDSRTKRKIRGFTRDWAAKTEAVRANQAWERRGAAGMQGVEGGAAAARARQTPSAGARARQALARRKAAEVQGHKAAAARSAALGGERWSYSGRLEVVMASLNPRRQGGGGGGRGGGGGGRGGGGGGGAIESVYRGAFGGGALGGGPGPPPNRSSGMHPPKGFRAHMDKLFERSIAQNDIWLGGWRGVLGADPSEGKGMGHNLAHGAGWGAMRPLVYGAIGLASIAQFGLPGAIFGATLGWGGSSALRANTPFFGSTWRDIRKQEGLKRRIADTMTVSSSPLNPVVSGDAGDLWNRSGSKPGAAVHPLQAEFKELFERDLTQSEIESISKGYGKRWTTKETYDGKLVHSMGARPFGARTGLEHMKRGAGQYIRHGLFSPLAWGVNAAFGVYDSSDNLFDPETGFKTALRRALGAEAGFMLGGTLGAAILTGGIPGIGALGWLGYGAGALLGAHIGTEIADIPLKLASLGRKYGRHRKPFRSAFLDSKQAQTMRQRSMQAIHRSQMNARSAFGSEALSYHA